MVRLSLSGPHGDGNLQAQGYLAGRKDVVLLYLTGTSLRPGDLTQHGVRIKLSVLLAHAEPFSGLIEQATSPAGTGGALSLSKR